MFARFLMMGLQTKGNEMDLIKGTAVIDQEWLKEWHETASETELNKRNTVWKVVGLKTAADCTYITSLDGATFVTILSGVFSDFIEGKDKEYIGELKDEIEALKRVLKNI